MKTFTLIAALFIQTSSFASDLDCHASVKEMTGKTHTTYNTAADASAACEKFKIEYSDTETTITDVTCNQKDDNISSCK